MIKIPCIHVWKCHNGPHDSCQLLHWQNIYKVKKNSVTSNKVSQRNQCLETDF
jgi:hypothetical protein